MLICLKWYAVVCLLQCNVVTNKTQGDIRIITTCIGFELLTWCFENKNVTNRLPTALAVLFWWHAEMIKFYYGVYFHDNMLSEYLKFRFEL